MWEDPIVKEVRKVRNTYARKFKYELTAIFNDLKDNEKKEKRKTVKLSGKVPFRAAS